jgi:RimJ/RimL family protein N-acetyltransferase
MTYTLRPAAPADLETVLTWIDTPDALRLWGGDRLTWPPEVEKTWYEIGADGRNSFALVDVDGRLAGFGQALPHDLGRVHLGRIILSPAARGQGLGRVLVRALIDAAREHFHPGVITLNVYRENLPAVRLYRSLGFVVVSEDEELGSYGMRLDGAETS